MSSLQRSQNYKFIRNLNVLLTQTDGPTTRIYLGKNQMTQKAHPLHPLLFRARIYFQYFNILIFQSCHLDCLVIAEFYLHSDIRIQIRYFFKRTYFKNLSAMSELKKQQDYFEKPSDMQFVKLKEAIKKLGVYLNIFWTFNKPNKYLRAKVKLYQSHNIYQSCLEVLQKHGLYHQFNIETLQKSFRAVDAFRGEFPDFDLKNVTKFAFLGANNINYQEILPLEWTEFPIKYIFIAKMHGLSNSSPIVEYYQIKQKFLMSFDKVNQTIPGMRQRIQANDIPFKLMLMATRFGNVYQYVKVASPQIPITVCLCGIYIGKQKAIEIEEAFGIEMSFLSSYFTKCVVEELTLAYERLQKGLGF